MAVSPEDEEALLIRAALRIQCVFRVARARRERKTRAVERKAAFERQCENDLAESAAVTLQAAQRRKAAKARVAELRSSRDPSGEHSPAHGASGESAAAAGNTEPGLTVQPPSLRNSVNAESASFNPNTSDGAAQQQPGSVSEVRSSDSLHPAGVEIVRRTSGPKVLSGRGSTISVSSDATVTDVMKSGVYESSASFMGASVLGREGLTTAFALASVASFATLMRDDPATGRQLKEWDPTMANHTLIHECAAIVIQGKWRVHEARCVVMRLKRERDGRRRNEDERQLEEVSAMAIQRNFRGHNVRAHTGAARRPGTPAKAREPGEQPPRRALSPNTAAVKIQCRQRTNLAKAEVNKRREQRQVRFAEEVEESLQTEAARTIQATQRRHAEQKRLAERKAAASGGPAPSNAAEPHAIKFRTTVAAAKIPAGSGHGLSAVFYAATSALLEKSTAPAERCLFWGVRALHTVTMDIALEASTDDSGADPRLPNLEVSRWIQGPLGSVVPLTSKVASSPARGGAGLSPRQLPALQHTAKTPDQGEPHSNEPSPGASRSPSKKQLEPINRKSDT
eukprot:CAMPEP_0174832056 /NCGR_PEP_ID=MMETSP1114-20130205/3460_1 /TAXON_ID=312471 /ORGANISM="Neobodo designis, Strain CCAP 1951/1" /LENGTH=567 /DNA_ID=CAMNT_0016065907 /DNA_START=172 /DNA_END=1872 /DNA_ORIENTATION=-